MANTESMDPSVQNILDHTSLKWIFVGGKGGVGKTTCSCSLAAQLAGCRDRVLIISTDPAHNLSDAFRQKFTRLPTLVNGFRNLYAMEIDPDPNIDVSSLDGGEGDTGSFLSEIASSIPGIDEAMSFAEVMKQVQQMDYSCIVFDTAPTGHTLRLLQFPTTLQKGLSKLMGLRGMLGGMLGQITQLLGGPAGGASNQLFDRLEEMQAVVEEVNCQFRDPELTTFVCVCIAEFLSLYETERLVQELTRFDMDTCNIIINQVIMGDEEIEVSRLLRARVRMQQRYLQQFHELYEDFHITLLPLLEEEVRGVDQIKQFSGMLVGGPTTSASGNPAPASQQQSRPKQ